MDDLVDAARAHFLQIEKVPLPSGSGIKKKDNSFSLKRKDSFPLADWTDHPCFCLNKAGTSLSNLSRDAIDRQAKAHLIFQRLCDPSSPLTIPETIDNLQEYLKEFRSEALVSRGTKLCGSGPCLFFTVVLTNDSKNGTYVGSGRVSATHGYIC
jgi:hypothetical protein